MSRRLYRLRYAEPWRTRHWLRETRLHLLARTLVTPSRFGGPA